MSHALIPGSFDPMTLGHLNIVKRALKEYDKVTVAVMINDAKAYAHTIEERAEMARLTVAGLANVQVITERLGGGGHMTIAGCQFEGISILEGINKIKRCLDEMLEEGEI